jgi:hypothetical protein
VAVPKMEAPARVSPTPAGATTVVLTIRLTPDPDVTSINAKGGVHYRTPSQRRLAISLLYLLSLGIRKDSTFPYGNLLITEVFSMNDTKLFQYRCGPTESDSRS